jgi:putative hydrolase
MKPAFDYHTHTVHSHGTGTVEQNVEAAISRGLSEIAISDHSVRHAFYAVRDVEAYLKDISLMRDKYKDVIKVKSALELNLLSLDGELDIPRGYEKSFDLLLFGFHKLVRFAGPSSALFFMLPKSHSEKAVRRYTDAYLSAIRNNDVRIITHIGYGLPVYKPEIAAAAAKKGVLLEINNKHPEFSPEELKECLSTGVDFILSSDAHRPQDVGVTPYSIQKAQTAGVPAGRIINAKEDA